VHAGRGRISRRTEKDSLLGVQQDQGGTGRVDCQSGADSPFGIAEAQSWSITGHGEARSALLVRIVAGEDRSHLFNSQCQAGFAGGVAQAQRGLVPLQVESDSRLSIRIEQGEVRSRRGSGYFRALLGLASLHDESGQVFRRIQPGL